MSPRLFPAGSASIIPLLTLVKRFDANFQFSVKFVFPPQNALYCVNGCPTSSQYGNASPNSTATATAVISSPNRRISRFPISAR